MLNYKNYIQESHIEKEDMLSYTNYHKQEGIMNKIIKVMNMLWKHFPLDKGNHNITLKNGKLQFNVLINDKWYYIQIDGESDLDNFEEAIEELKEII